MKAQTRKRANLALAWFFLAHAPAATYLLIYEPKLWKAIAVFYLVLVSIWTAAFTHFAAAAADSPTEEDE